MSCQVNFYFPSWLPLWRFAYIVALSFHVLVFDETFCARLSAGVEPSHRTHVRGTRVFLTQTTRENLLGLLNPRNTPKLSKADCLVALLKIILTNLILKTPPKGEYSSDLYSLEKLSPYANLPVPTQCPTTSCHESHITSHCDIHFCVTVHTKNVKHVKTCEVIY